MNHQIQFLTKNNFRFKCVFPDKVCFDETLFEKVECIFKNKIIVKVPHRFLYYKEVQKGGNGNKIEFKHFFPISKV